MHVMVLPRSLCPVYASYLHLAMGQISGILWDK